MNSENLSVNEFYLLVSSEGYVLKTKNKTEIQDVSRWKGILFCGIVKNSQLIEYVCGSKLAKKRIHSIPKSDSWEKDYCFDFSNLDLHGCTSISKIVVGGLK